MLTNLSLHNIKRDSIQRTIRVDSISAVSKSLEKGCNKFVVHVKSEYDYIFESELINEIFEALKYVYYIMKNKNLPVYVVKNRKSLK